MIIDPFPKDYDHRIIDSNVDVVVVDVDEDDERIYLGSLLRTYRTYGTSTSSPLSSLQQISNTNDFTYGSIRFFDTRFNTSVIFNGIRSSQRYLARSLLYPNDVRFENNQ
ncbi:hypothetical protein DERP_006452 [Dermatophagoides pteronyssinus]|uniref:Uncharacterized protein n=1 Tax=Dermatophagoides pteronyssinus TaxID=6956 RepID=A0ABQ8IQ64_DERPT|nr:hypothetical protein DERP_006452 [Dermatophagoides pteronyssinus]